MKPVCAGAPGVLDLAFPGEIAGASLKRHVGPDRQPRTARFPGEIAGASLKHKLARSLRAKRVSSPAKSPGPH